MDAPPDKLKYAAIAQIIVGLIDIFVSWWVIWMVWGTAGFALGTCLAVITLGLCPVGYFVGCIGMLGFLTIPLGILEVIGGILGLTQPKTGGTVMKVAAALGMVSLLFGSLGSAIGGGVVLMFLSDGEVKGYLSQS